LGHHWGFEMTKQQKKAKLELIAQEIASRKCGLQIALDCQNPVPGNGNPHAQLMFVGEAPGAKEDLLGQPFVGASGKFLDEMLESIGLSREEVFVTNIVKFRPPKNRDPNAHEIEVCLPYLLAQIEVVEPRLVVLLGRHSMNVFLPDQKISEAHGKIFIKPKITFLPLYHPAAALYNGKLRSTLKADFAQIPKILEQL
jgi:DNA polymerase